MTEDSGAFKTKPRNSAQIGHFVIAGDRQRQPSGTAAAKMPHRAKNAVDRRKRAIISQFYNKQVRDL
jgi:hypothetical protein